MLTPDSIVPDPANPQSYNRYSYVENRPTVFSDPTGHCAESGDDGCWSIYDQIMGKCPQCNDLGWGELGIDNLRVKLDLVNTGWRPHDYTCTGRTDCYDIIDNWLNYLNNSGDVGVSLANDFLLSGTTVHFVDDQDLMMSAPNSKTIKVGNQKMENIINLEGDNGNIILMTQFGHEIEHLRQGYWGSRSIQGEYLGYRTQIQIAEGWDNANGGTLAVDLLVGNGSPTTRIIWLGQFNRDWYANDLGNLNPNSRDDMKYFYHNYLKSAGYKLFRYLPLFQ